MNESYACLVLSPKYAWVCMKLQRVRNGTEVQQEEMDEEKGECPSEKQKERIKN
jgi:hypothetical protein